MFACGFFRIYLEDFLAKEDIKEVDLLTDELSDSVIKIRIFIAQNKPSL